MAVLRLNFFLFWSQAALKAAAAQARDGKDEEVAALRTEVEVIYADN